jgi:hypothetical protein
VKRDRRRKRSNSKRQWKTTRRKPRVNVWLTPFCKRFNEYAYLFFSDSIFKDYSIPSTSSIHFHAIRSWNSSSGDLVNGIDLSSLPMFTQFSDVKSNFGHLIAVLDTSDAPRSLRPYIPLFTELLLESPMKIAGKTIPYEMVVKHLNQDTVFSGVTIGLGGSRMASGAFAQNVLVHLKVEREKFGRGIEWLHDIVFQTVFTQVRNDFTYKLAQLFSVSLMQERVKVIATKVENGIAEMKRSGSDVAKAMAKMITFGEDSNKNWNTMFRQQTFLKVRACDCRQVNVLKSDMSSFQTLLKKMNCPEGHKSVLMDLLALRAILGSRIAVYAASDFDQTQQPLHHFKRFEQTGLKK